MPRKKSAAAQRKKQNKKKLQSEQASYKDQLEKPEVKSEGPQKSKQEKALENVLLKELYLHEVEQIKLSEPFLEKLIAIKLGDQVVCKAINKALKNLKGSINRTDPPLPQNDYERGLKYLAKAFFGKKNNNLFFNKAINFFEKAHQEKDLSQYCKDIEIYLFTIRNYYISSDFLQKDADLIKSYFPNISYSQLALAYSNKCKLLMLDSHYNYAKAAGKIAYDMLQLDQSISDDVKLQVVYNMALCTSKYDLVKAMEYYEEAEKIAPKDHDVIHDKFMLYLQQSLVKEAFLEAEKFSPDKAKLYKMNYNVQNHPDSCAKIEPIFNKLNLSEATKKGVPYLTVKARIDAHQMKFNESIEFNKKLILSTDDSEQQSIYFINALISYVSSYREFGKKQVKSLLRFYESIYEEIQMGAYHKSFALTYYECMFYSKCSLMREAKSKLDDLNKLVKDNSSLDKNKLHIQEAEKVYVANLIEAQEFSDALNFIKNESIASEIDKQKDIALINKLIEFRESSAELVLEGSEELQVEQILEQPEQPVTFCLIDWAASPEELASYVDPRVINAYFQNKKAQSYKKSLSNNSVEPQEISWDISDKISYESLFAIQQKPHFHAAISDKMLGSLDEGVKQQFLKAIGSGIVTRQQGQNGIKFIGSQLVELKINADQRLYTKKIYKNSDGEYLIIFDCLGNHKAVSKAMNGSIEIIETENIKLDMSFASQSLEEGRQHTVYGSSYFEQKHIDSSSISDAELSGDQDLQDVTL